MVTSAGEVNVKRLDKQWNDSRLGSSAKILGGKESFVDADDEPMDLMYRASAITMKEMHKLKQSIQGTTPSLKCRLGAAWLHRSVLKGFLLFCSAIYASVIYHYMHAMLAHKKKCESGIKEGRHRILRRPWNLSSPE